MNRSLLIMSLLRRDNRCYAQKNNMLLTYGVTRADNGVGLTVRCRYFAAAARSLASCDGRSRRRRVYANLRIYEEVSIPDARTASCC